MAALQTAIKIFIFILLGFFLRKIKVVGDGFDKLLTKFLMSLVIPCMIVNSFNIEFSMQDLLECPIIMLLSLGGILVCYIIGILITIKTDRDMRQMIKYSMMFTNFTFMGFAVVNETLDAKGVFHYVIYCFLIRILFYGSAPFLLGKKQKINIKEIGKKLLTAPVIAVIIGFLLYILPFEPPTLVTSILSSIGNMATPLGLMLCGIIIAEAQWDGILKYPKVFWLSAIRLIGIPAVILGLSLLFRINNEFILPSMFYYMMPVGSLVPIFLLQHNPDAVETRITAGYLVTASSLFCIGTIPLWTILLDKIFIP